MISYKMKTMNMAVISIMMIFVISGCASVKFTSTIEQKSLDLAVLSGHRLKIVSIATKQQYMYQAVVAPHIPYASVDEYMNLALQRYPTIFSLDSDSLPVAIKLYETSESDSFFILHLVTAVLTLGTLPNYPAEFSTRFNAELFFADTTLREFCIETVTFDRTNAMWITVYTPFGLIPVPGKSDLPKVSGVGKEFVRQSSDKLTMISAVDAVVQAAINCGTKAFSKVR